MCARGACRLRGLFRANEQVTQVVNRYCREQAISLIENWPVEVNECNGDITSTGTADIVREAIYQQSRSVTRQADGQIASHTDSSLPHR
jgi:hypothetical protein